MKVLLFTESYPTPEHPGRGVFLQRQAEALAKSHDVTICFPQPWIPGIDSRCLEPRSSSIHGEVAECRYDKSIAVRRPRYLYIPRHRKIRISMLERLLRRELDTGDFDIVHAHWISPAGAAAVRACVERKVPVLVTAHAGDVYRELKSPLHRKIARETLLNADAIISVAGYFKSSFQELEICDEKICYIPNGVDDSFRYTPHKTELRNQLNLPTGVPLFAYLGNLYPAKGAGTVLEAFAALGHQDARLLIAGQGPMAEKLQLRARELGISDRVIFRDWYSHELMSAVLGAIDFFVLASEAEGNPVTVLESLCCGTPVLGSNIEAIKDIINPRVNGLLFPARNGSELARAMMTAIKHPWVRDEISVRAKNEYSWNVVVDRIESCYEKVVNDRNS